MRLPVSIVLFVLFLASYAALAQSEVANTAEDICPLLPGTKIPDVELQRADGTPFSLANKIAEKPSILIFYRGGW